MKVAGVLASTVVATLLAPPTSQASAQQPTASLPTQRAGVQRPWRMSVRADNDAFNFWRSITDRPDKEYTNGDQVVIEIAGAPWWGKRFAKGRSPCDGAETLLRRESSARREVKRERPERDIPAVLFLFAAPGVYFASAIFLRLSSPAW